MKKIKSCLQHFLHKKGLFLLNMSTHVVDNNNQSPYSNFKKIKEFKSIQPLVFLACCNVVLYSYTCCQNFFTYVPYEYVRTSLGYSRKNPKRIRKRIYFSETPPLQFLYLSFYPQNFWRKQAFTTGNSAKLCDTSCNSKIKNQGPWKFHRSFSGPPLRISLLFYLTPGISTYSFFNSPGNFIHLTPPRGTGLKNREKKGPVWIFLE